MGSFLSASAIRGVDANGVLEAVEEWFDARGVRCSRSEDVASSSAVRIFEPHQGWTTVLWPHHFLPRDIDVCRVLSRELHTVVSTVSTTPAEGWSHAVLGCGTLLDRFHSYPWTLSWDGEDALALAAEWSGDPDLVARVFGVPASSLRRHFSQACPDTRDHPGKDTWGFVALWAALGITYPEGRVPRFATLEVDPAWQRLTAVVRS